MTLTTPFLTQTRADVKTAIGVRTVCAAVGTSTTTPAAGDTALGNEVFRDNVDDHDLSVLDKITISLRIGTSEANNNLIGECALLSAGNQTVDDMNVATGWTDSTDCTASQNVATYMQGTAALSITKDGTTTTNCSTSKTVTSRDFTDKQLSFHVYIKDATTLNKLASTNALKVRYGSDASNFYEYRFDRSELTTLFDRIFNLTSSNADATTGTPVLAAMDYLEFVFTTNNTSDTWTAGDIVVDHVEVGSGTLWTHSTITPILKTDDIQLYLDVTITVVVTEA